MRQEVLYATNNPGKFAEVAEFLKRERISVLSPAEIGLSLEVSETGNTLEENATLKAEAARRLFAGIVIADDTGFEIKALSGEPGTHVRRWKDGRTRMGDEEIIAYCLERMRGVPQGEREVRLRTVIALAMPGEDIELFDGSLEGEILERPIDLRMEGFPLESLFFVPKWQMVLGEFHQLPLEKKRGYLTHRTKAVRKVTTRIKEVFWGSS